MIDYPLDKKYVYTEEKLFGVLHKKHPNIEKKDFDIKVCSSVLLRLSPVDGRLSVSEGYGGTEHQRN